MDDYDKLIDDKLDTIKLYKVVVELRYIFPHHEKFVENLTAIHNGIIRLLKIKPNTQKEIEYKTKIYEKIKNILVDEKNDYDVQFDKLEILKKNTKKMLISDISKKEEILENFHKEVIDIFKNYNTICNAVVEKNRLKDKLMNELCLQK